MKNYLKWGTYNSICDVCGQKYKADQLRERWDGLLVCSHDYETRHPQSLIKLRPERGSVSGPVRPETTDTFVDVCYIWERTCYAGLASADCATTKTSEEYSYEFLANARDEGTL